MPARRRVQEPVEVSEVLAWIERKGSKKVRAGLARFAIPADRAVGIPMGVLRQQGKKLGRSHALATALWESGGYEARMLAAFVEDPELVTPAQMDAWAADFDNWAICDTVCFALFDRSPHAWGRVKAWSGSEQEWIKRGAFALLASLAGHDKAAPDSKFLDGLKRVERAAGDERNFVKKGVSWALRAVGHRNKALHGAAVAAAGRLAASKSGAARWVGKDALRDLQRPAVLKKVSARG
jgi:3-methyladenine DNA glycosylase AlkD